MAKKLPKIELALLKKLVGELETAVNTIQELPLVDNDQIRQFIVELSKASGLAAGVAQESSALTKDMYRLSAMVQQSAMPAGEDLLAELFGGVMVDDPEKKNRN